MKILVVDDSIVFRSAITQALQTVPEFDVYKSVVKGKLALDILRMHPDTDLITLDMEMPVMDGMETIREIRKTNKDIIIIVFSSLTIKGAEKTLEALNLGADDFVTKTEGSGNIDQSLNQIKEDLLPKILAFKNRRVKRSQIRERIEVKTHSAAVPSILNLNLPIKPRLLVIGISTGGPEALARVFKTITENVTIPMLIVQHMPAMFTEKLAEMLNKLSPTNVREAKIGDKLEPGVCLIAPGDYHMTVSRSGEIQLNQNEKVCFVRPAVDVLLDSLAQNFDKQILTFIMTGMGEDGAAGVKKIASKGAYIFIQDKESSSVWGMPGSVEKAIGSEARVIALDEIGLFINTLSKRL